MALLPLNCECLGLYPVPEIHGSETDDVSSERAEDLLPGLMALHIPDVIYAAISAEFDKPATRSSYRS